MSEQRYHEQMIARLNELIRDCTLRSRFYGIRGALLLDEARAHHFRKLGRRAEGLSTRISTYYAAASAARARAKNNPLFLRPLWLLIGYACFRRSIYLADALIYREGGFESLSANQADVYVHTVLARKRYNDAVHFAEMLLSRADASADNRALMQRIMAEVLIVRGRYRDAEQMLDSALQSGAELPPLTIVRLLRTKGVLYDQRRNRQMADSFFERARAVALQHNFTGQLEKIEARQ